MDDSSGDLVRALARAAADQPWLVCLTRRRVATGLVLESADDGQRVVLEPLGRDATALLVAAATTSAPLPQHVADELVDRADGNPLFLLELLSALREGGDISSLPGTIEGLISAPGGSPGGRGPRSAAPGRGARRGIPRRLPRCGRRRRRSRRADALAVDRVPRIRRDRLGDLPPRARTRRRVRRPAVPRRANASTARSRTRSSPHSDDGADGDAALLSLHFFHAQRYDETWRVRTGRGRRGARGVRERGSREVVRPGAGGGTQSRRCLRRRARGRPRGTRRRAGPRWDVRRVACRLRRDPQAPRGDATATGRVLLKEAFVAERRGRYSEAVRAIHRAERTLDGVVSPEADRLRAQLLVWLAAIRANQGLLARAIVAARDGVCARRDRGRRRGAGARPARARLRGGGIGPDPRLGSAPRPRSRSTPDSAIWVVRRPRRTCSARPRTTTAAGRRRSTGTRRPDRTGQERRPGERGARRLQHHRDPRRPGPPRRSRRAHRGRGRDLGRGR